MKQPHASPNFVPPILLQERKHGPLYRQLYEWFRTAITEGRLRPGQRLPSTRSMAAELDVSRISVFHAYEQLQSEGYLETSIGSGTCVAKNIPDEAFSPALLHRRKRSREVLPLAPRVSRRAALLSDSTAETWLHSLGPFRVSLPALDHFPVNIWSRLVARHCRKLSRSTMAYGDAMGYLPFREALAEYLNTYRSVRCDASQILVTSGSQQALQISAQVLLDPGDQVLIEEPGYPGARVAFLSAGARLTPRALDGEGMIVPKRTTIKGSPAVAYVTPSHQYPLGMTMSAARRMELLQWAAGSDGWIIEDDYDSEYRFASRPMPSLQGLDVHERVIYIGTFSKVLFPALRVGYMVVPKNLIRYFSATRDATDIFSSTIYQAVLADFISEGHFARHIRRMRMLYMERRKELVCALHSQLAGTVEVVGAEAGMHLVVLLPPGTRDVSVSEQAAEQRISAIPLSSCYLKSPSAAGLILGYGGCSVRQIRDASAKLALVIRRCLSPNGSR